MGSTFPDDILVDQLLLRDPRNTLPLFKCNRAMFALLVGVKLNAKLVTRIMVADHGRTAAAKLYFTHPPSTLSEGVRCITSLDIIRAGKSASLYTALLELGELGKGAELILLQHALLCGDQHMSDLLQKSIHGRITARCRPLVHAAVAGGLFTTAADLLWRVEGQRRPALIKSLFQRKVFSTPATHAAASQGHNVLALLEAFEYAPTPSDLAILLSGTIAGLQVAPFVAYAQHRARHRVPDDRNGCLTTASIVDRICEILTRSSNVEIAKATAILDAALDLGFPVNGTCIQRLLFSVPPMAGVKRRVFDRLMDHYDGSGRDLFGPLLTAIELGQVGAAGLLLEAGAPLQSGGGRFRHPLKSLFYNRTREEDYEACLLSLLVRHERHRASRTGALDDDVLMAGMTSSDAEPIFSMVLRNHVLLGIARTSPSFLQAVPTSMCDRAWGSALTGGDVPLLRVFKAMGYSLRRDVADLYST